MKKLAYTLAEILIAMSIIGIIGAVAAPAITSARPDANKVVYLRIYDNLTRLSQEIASNSLFYLPMSNNNTIDANMRNVSTVPLMDLNQPMDARFAACSGRTKFGCLLANILGGTNINDNHRNQVSFNTPEGRWQVIYQSGEYSDLNPSRIYRVIVDTDISDNGWRFYNRNNPNNKHDTYEFWVNMAGSTIPVDLLGQMYVDTRLVTTTSRKIRDLVEDGITAGKYSDGGNFNQFNKIIPNVDCPRTGI